MQMNLLRKVSLLEFRAASSSDAVKPTPSARIGFGRAGAAGHRRATRLESSVRNLGGLAIAKAKRGVGRGHSSGEAGQCPWMRRASACKRVYIGFNGGGSDTSRVPHGEPYAGKLHVRFDEGAGVPHGASRSTLHPRSPFPTKSEKEIGHRFEDWFFFRPRLGFS